MKCSTAEAFWARIDAKNTQMTSFYTLKTDTDCEVIRIIEGGILGIVFVTVLLIEEQIKLDKEEQNQQKTKQEEEDNGEKKGSISLI